MKKYPTILSIAGSDSSGGAGIQADIKTISALGAYAATAITAITVQNTTGVSGIHPVPPFYVEGQIHAVIRDLKPEAIKIGMINDAEIALLIAKCIKEYKLKNVVFDPVMVSTSGSKLVNDSAIKVLINELIPVSTLITPNLSEVEVLIGKRCNDTEEMICAAKELLSLGSRSVLVKGGHLRSERMVDILQLNSQEEPLIFEAKYIDSKNVHGTGCTLSSAIATFLALGHTLPSAVQAAKEYVTGAIEAGKEVSTGKGSGPLNHSFAPNPMKIIDIEGH